MYSNELTAFDLFRAFTCQFGEIHGNRGLAPWLMIKKLGNLLYVQTTTETYVGHGGVLDLSFVWPLILFFFISHCAAQ